jgi:hypothetical protein
MKPTNQKIYDEVVTRVKASVNRWPSAYASGMVVREYKRLMAIRGEAPYIEENKPTTSLARWYKEKWIDIATGKPCGSVRSASFYPTCRPSVRVSAQTPKLASELTAAQRRKAILAKQSAREGRITF